MNYKIIYKDEKQFCEELEKVENNENNFLEIGSYKHEDFIIKSSDFIINKLEKYKKVKLGIDMFRCINLTIFPETLCKLTNLVYLDLTCNELTTLPLSFSSLINLKNLDISHNRFKVFPEIICKLKYLMWLNIYGNKISYIPISITKLTNLQCLKHDTYYEKIPYILCDLKNFFLFSSNLDDEYDYWDEERDEIQNYNNEIEEFHKNLKKKSFLYRLFFILHKNLNKKLNYKILEKIKNY